MDLGRVLIHLLQDDVGRDVDSVAGLEVKEQVSRIAKECFLSAVSIKLFEIYVHIINETLSHKFHPYSILSA